VVRRAFVWASNGRRADGDVTDHRLPEALAPPTSRRALVSELRRRARDPLRLRPVASGSGPFRLCVTPVGNACRLPPACEGTSKPTRTVAWRPNAEGGPVERAVLASDRPTCSTAPSRSDVGLSSDARRRQTGPPSPAQADDEPTRRDTDPAHSPGDDGPRTHPDQRLSGTPRRTRHLSARNRSLRPRDQRFTTAVLGGPLTVHPDAHPALGPQRRCWCHRATTKVQRLVTTLSS
jgi:hypothetical protein